MMPSLDDIRSEYAKTIERNLPHKLTNYLGMGEEAQKFEAIVFRFFYCLDFGIELFDLGNNGGPDFRIFQQNGKQEFYVEVTTLEKQALANRIDIPLEPDFNDLNIWGSFGADWEGVLNKLDSKNHQLRNHTSLPTVLFIGTENPEHYIFEGSVIEGIAAPWCVMGRLEHDITNGIQTNYEEISTQFEPSLFFDMLFEDGKLKPINRNISAIIFSPFNFDFMHICGFKHPKPIETFNQSILSEIPFFVIDEDHSGLTYSSSWVPRQFNWDRFYYDCSFRRGSNFSIV